MLFGVSVLLVVAAQDAAATAGGRIIAYSCCRKGGGSKETIEVRFGFHYYRWMSRINPLAAALHQLLG